MGIIFIEPRTSVYWVDRKVVDSAKDWDCCVTVRFVTVPPLAGITYPPATFTPLIVLTRRSLSVIVPARKNPVDMGSINAVLPVTN